MFIDSNEDSDAKEAYASFLNEEIKKHVILTDNMKSKKCSKVKTMGSYENEMENGLS